MRKAFSVHDLVPESILARANSRSSFACDIDHYSSMPLADLYRATETCLKNVSRLDDEDGIRKGKHCSSDSDLRLVIVPELWERLKPGSRMPLRRISSSLAEYDPDKPSVFRKLLSSEAISELREGSHTLRARIEFAKTLRVSEVTEWMRFSILGVRIGSKWPSDYPVYDTAFAYRLIPAVAWRALRFVPEGVIE